MLAVSGSVEAARAGESGRGFAVVSSDIRSLAREAAESVERVKDTVRGILDQITSLRRDLEQIIATAELEVQDNRAILAGAAEPRRRRRLADRGQSGHLRGRGRHRGWRPTQMSVAARQIAAAAEEASAASRQAATASTQQARGAEDLAAAIEEIASLADELKQQNG